MTERDFQLAIQHLDYELTSMVDMALRLKDPKDGVERNAYLEGMLLHARNLIEFLRTKSTPRSDDMWPGDFVTKWDAAKIESFDHEWRSTNKHLSHLTWTRTEVSGTWDTDDIVPRVLDAFRTFVELAERQHAARAVDLRTIYMHSASAFRGRSGGH